MISAMPDVKRIKINKEDEFMVLACDGIWNSLSSEEVVNFVRTRIQKGETKMSAICEEVSKTNNRKLKPIFISPPLCLLLPVAVH